MYNQNSSKLWLASNPWYNQTWDMINQPNKMMYQNSEVSFFKWFGGPTVGKTLNSHVHHQKGTRPADSVKNNDSAGRGQPQSAGDVWCFKSSALFFLVPFLDCAHIPLIDFKSMLHKNLQYPEFNRFKIELSQMSFSPFLQLVGQSHKIFYRFFRKPFPSFPHLGLSDNVGLIFPMK